MIAGDLGDEPFRLRVGEDIVDDCILLALAGEDLGDGSVSFSTKAIYVKYSHNKNMQVDKSWKS